LPHRARSISWEHSFQTNDVWEFNGIPKPGWEQRLYRLAPSNYESRVRRIRVGVGIAVEEATLTGEMRLDAVTRSDTLNISFVSGRQARLGGSWVPSGMVGITPPGCGFLASTSQTAGSHSIDLTGTSLRRVLSAEELEHLGDLVERTSGNGVLLRPETDSAATLRDLLRGMLAASATMGDVIADVRKAEPMRAELGDLSREVLYDLMGSAPDEPERKNAARWRELARAVETAIWESVAAPRANVNVPGLTELSEALFVSRRTVQAAVKRYFGISFHALSLSIRLHNVHSELRASGPSASITDIASRYGFWHLGRFAYFYKRQFGFKPSETWPAVRSPAH
jgi:AraC-like DNA-binding protein